MRESVVFRSRCCTGVLAYLWDVRRCAGSNAHLVRIFPFLVFFLEKDNPHTKSRMTRGLDCFRVSGTSTRDTSFLKWPCVALIRSSDGMRSKKNIYCLHTLLSSCGCKYSISLDLFASLPNGSLGTNSVLSFAVSSFPIQKKRLVGTPSL